MTAKKGNIPWNKGKKTGPLSEEQRKKQSLRMTGENNPFYGKKHTKESKRKISESNIGRMSWNKGKKCPKISKTLIGHTLSEETRKKISETLKKRYRDGMESPFRQGHTIRNTGRTRFKEGRRSSSKGKNINEIYGEERAKEISEKIRKARLKQIFPKQDSSIEKLMQKELGRRGIVFKKHVSLLNKYQVDIKIGDLVIECDGNYWHCFPNGTENDHRRNTDLKEAGYSVLRFWGSEINDNVSHCVDVVEEVLGCPVGH